MTFRGCVQRCLFLLLLLPFVQVRADVAESKMEFAYYTDTIYATGSIDVEAASRLKELVRSKGVPPGTVVAFSSAGGSVVGGIQLGQTLRDLQLKANVFRYIGSDTYRGEDGLGAAYTFDKNEAADCVSACVYAYLGGVQRYLYSESRLGIHQFYFPAEGKSGSAADAQVLSAAIVAYLSRMGINPTLFSATALFGKDEMRYLSRQEAEDFGLVNNGIVRSVVRYQVSKGRPYPELLQESDEGTYKLGLLCSEGQVYLGASRELKKRSAFYDAGDELFFWIDGQPVFKMDSKKDTFYQALDASMLAKLFSSRRLRLWTLADGFEWDGTDVLVSDWSQFHEYASGCGV